ncbi:MAG: helix-turn-helix transcriptional regulator, partial [Ignavibacteriales bacterium]|nr:helix-turn-helix transcriptional regulator [Ignavibacteriales bacterium]
MSKINKIIGQKINQLRTSKKMNQQKLANYLGISRPTITQIEKGERYLTPEEILKLSEYFNISLNELINPKLKGEVILHEDESESHAEESLRISVPQKNLKKFKEVLLYILNKVGAKPNI